MNVPICGFQIESFQITPPPIICLELHRQLEESNFIELMIIQ